MRRSAIYAIAAALTTGLSGCGDVNPIPPPPERLVCSPDPLVPVLSDDPEIKEAQKAAYLTALWMAGSDCRAALAWLKDYWGK